MPISKIGNIKLETSAYYVPLGDTNIKFWNMDIKTAILRFQVTRNKIVLPLGKNNVQAYITLFASDGSNITDNLVIDDELNGIVSYTIPKEFLAHTGTVHGQVYISVNGTEETVTEADFTFEIKDALINKILSETKISYIRIFDDLKTVINQKVSDILAKIEAGQDIVTAIEAARDDAIQKINSAIAGAKSDIDDKVTTATTDLNKTATDATKAITDTAKSATDSVDVAMNEFHTDLENNNFAKKSDLDKLQSFPITTVDGLPYSASSITDWQDMLTINATRVAVNASILSNNAPPEGIYFDVNIFRRTKTTGHIEAVNMVNSAKWINSLSGTGWSGWKKLETTAGSAQKVADLKTALLDMLPTAEDGSQKVAVGATQDIYEEFLKLPAGLYTLYANGASKNNVPTARSIRGIIMKTSPDFGYIIAVDYTNNLFTNYYDANNGWSGWKAYGSTLLWSGSTVAVKNGVFNLSQSKQNFKFLAFVINLPNANGDQVIYMPASNNNNISLEVTNVFDDASGALHYELVLAKTSATKLTVVSEARFNVATGNGVLDNKDFTIKEIWGVN